MKQQSLFSWERAQMCHFVIEENSKRLNVGSKLGCVLVSKFFSKTKLDVLLGFV